MELIIFFFASFFFALFCFAFVLLLYVRPLLYLLCFIYTALQLIGFINRKTSFTTIYNKYYIDIYSLTLDLVSVNGDELNFIFAIVGLTAHDILALCLLWPFYSYLYCQPSAIRLPMNGKIMRHILQCFSDDLKYKIHAKLLCKVN